MVSLTRVVSQEEHQFNDFPMDAPESYPRDIIPHPLTNTTTTNRTLATSRSSPLNPIRSEQPELLPSTDINQPRFPEDSVEGHLDTHFHLYRRDFFFGEAKGGHLRIHVGSRKGFILSGEVEA
jgi:hypothetical protein